MTPLTPLLGSSGAHHARRGRMAWIWGVLSVCITAIAAAACCYGLLKALASQPLDPEVSLLQRLQDVILLNSTELAPRVAALQLDHASLQGRTPVVKVVNGTLSEALQALTPCSGLVVIVVGNTKPQRRLPTQPFLQISPVSVMESLAHAINDGAAGIEAALGRRLFPLHLTFTDRLRSLGGSNSGVMPVGLEPAMLDPACKSEGHTRPHVVYEVATGTVLLDDELSSPLQRAPKVQAMLVSITIAMFDKITAALRTAATALGAANALALVSAAGTAGLSIAFASTVPMWYCFACPIVLGLLAPLLINAGLGEAADLTCKALALTDTECFDLFLGALGVGVLLALLSAFPIFKVCKLYECSHPGA